MFDTRTSCVVVVGAQWGDEGKGKLVDVLAEAADVVVRFQGGANAGHTVVLGDSQFILRQIPSGILHGTSTCVLGNGVVLDADGLFSELLALNERGIATAGRVLVSNRAHLVLPYHKLLDAAGERSQNIGTTRRGIGPAYVDKYDRRGIRVGDLRNMESTLLRLEENIQRANTLLPLAGMTERASLEEHVALLTRVAPKLLPLVTDTGRYIHTALKQSKRVLLEGAQGALLDVDHGTYPFVTSSNTTAGGASVGAGIGPTAIHAVLGVVKAYTTRVGEGPLPSLALPPLEEHLRSLGGEFGAVTGRPRRCGWFDAMVVQYSARVNGLTGLAVTKLDVLDSFDDIPVCVAYDVGGERCAEMPSEVGQLAAVKPVYERFQGWKQPTGNARKLEDLPKPARAYLDYLEVLVEVPIRFVSVGTRRDQIIEAGK